MTSRDINYFFSRDDVTMRFTQGEREFLAQELIVYNMLLDTKLKPCPLCNSKVELKDDIKILPNKQKDRVWYNIKCTNDGCLLHGGFSALNSSLEIMIDKWNSIPSNTKPHRE